MNYSSVFRLLAFITLFVAALMSVPMSIAIAQEEYVSFWAFLITISAMMLVALSIVIATQERHKRIYISAKDSYLFVTLTWITISFFGCLPFIFSGTIPSFSSAFFEIMSGFSTTGATLLDDIEAAPKSILFWRNMTNWLGGMGIVVLFIAVLPAFGVKGTALVGAESVGPTKDKLTPQIQYTALALWLIYIGLSILETILLLFGGLSVFDAVTITFGTMGAAGYAPKNASIGAYPSAFVQWVVIVFMFLAGVNFALYFKAIQGKIKKVFRDGELRIYTCIVLTASLLIAFDLIFSSKIKASVAVRDAFFQVISFITTTGFTTTNYSLWPVFSQAVLFALCFIGGCAGSAGGGIKVIRVAVVAKLGGRSIKKRLHPTSVSNITIGDDSFDQDTLLSISGFVGLYLITMILGTILISLTNNPFDVCYSSVILTLGNIGVGFGGIGTNFTFSIYPDWALWVFSFLMLVGRLELFTVYALFTRSFWRK